MRALDRRTAIVRDRDLSSLVLGSTQPVATVDLERAGRAHVAVERRRSGGGAVLLSPGGYWWIDLWVPAGDPLSSADVVGASAWVGEWCVRALARSSVRAVRADGRAPSGGAARLVCFAGTGPGEVLVDGRKLTGVAQWRAREGALFHCFCHRVWAPGPLVDLLSMPAPSRVPFAESLAPLAIGFDQLPVAGPSVEALLDALPDDRPWEVFSG